MEEEQEIISPEEKFVRDSLNDQKKRISVVHNSTFNELKLQIEQDQSFMKAMQTAINHFEKNANEELQKDSKKSTNFSRSIFNNTNTTNTSGEHKKDNTLPESENIKREYTTLLIKYNELKAKNKALMNDYAVIRSQVEELKSVTIFIHLL